MPDLLVGRGISAVRPLGRSRLTVAGSGWFHERLFGEHHRKQIGAVFVLSYGLHREVYESGATFLLEADSRPLDRLLVAEGLPQRLAQRQADGTTGHLHDVHARHPGGKLEIATGSAMDVDHFALAVHEYRRRGVAVEEKALENALGLRGGCVASDAAGAVIGARPADRKLHAGARVHTRVCRLRPVEAGVAGEGCKEIGVVPDGFRGSEQEESAGVETVMKERHEPLLDLGLEVDHEVSTGEEIEAGERRILYDVLGGEDDHVPHRLYDLVAVTVSGEIAMRALLTEVGLNGGRKDTATCPFDRVLVDIRGENVHRSSAAGVVEELSDGDGHRVCFLAGRTAGNPHADRLVRCAVAHELGQNAPLQLLERFRFAEESGYADNEVPKEKIHLPWRVSQIANVVLECIYLVNVEPPLQPSLNGRLLVCGEVVADLLTEDDKDLVHLFVELFLDLLLVLASLRKVIRVIEELRREALRGGDVVYDTIVDGGLGHSREGGRLR